MIPQLLHRVQHRLGQFAVVGGQDAFLGLHHADLDPELAVGDAQFQADVAAADHGQAVGQGLGRQGLGGGNDRPADGQHRQVDAFRTGGQQQVLALDAGIGAFDFHGLAVDDPGPALNHLDLVFLQQRGDPGGQAVDDAVLPFHALADVQGWRRHFDAQGRALAVVAGLVELLGDMDQRLGRDAADVQAGAAQGLAFHQNGGDAQLAGADGRHVTARAAADDQQLGIESLLHVLLHKQRGGLFEQAANGLDELRSSMPSTTR